MFGVFYVDINFVGLFLTWDSNFPPYLNEFHKFVVKGDTMKYHTTAIALASIPRDIKYDYQVVCGRDVCRAHNEKLQDMLVS